MKEYSGATDKEVFQMPKVIATGVQDFERLRIDGSFYVDKTSFIREWWNNRDAVTLITRPRRFGKTLNMSMMNCFFSLKYADRDDLFKGLEIWEDEAFRKLQGTYPVIYLSLANVKHDRYQLAIQSVNRIIANIFNDYRWMLNDEMFSDQDREFFSRVRIDMDSETAGTSINQLCMWMEKYYGKKVLIFLDEYDAPMQEAYLHGYWDDMVTFFRLFFNSTFKTNPSLHRAILTGITRISRESIFSDLNNLAVITSTSTRYATAFGFTEEEVFKALDDQGFGEKKADVKSWYDGFTFGNVTDIYNPWSVTNFLLEGTLRPYWVNTSANSLLARLLQKSDKKTKTQFETLMKGNSLEIELNEEIVLNQLDTHSDALWSLLLATGYLKLLCAPRIVKDDLDEHIIYTLAITNLEVRMMFRKMIIDWFSPVGAVNDFIQAMLMGNIEEMEVYLNNIMKTSMSFFDADHGAGDHAPENFYHGFVLGLLVGKPKEYQLRSNRESGLGRYDVTLEPQNPTKPAVILEFKVFNPRRGEKTLDDTVANALKQIEEKKYDTEFLARGIPADHILKYGLAFRGKECQIAKGKSHFYWMSFDHPPFLRRSAYARLARIQVSSS